MEFKATKWVMFVSKFEEVSYKFCSCNGNSATTHTTSDDDKKPCLRYLRSQKAISKGNRLFAKLTE